MRFRLNTGRTIWQGQAIEAGKDLDLYVKAAAVVYINEEDMEKLGIKEGDNVKVKSDWGEVVLKAKKAIERNPEGYVYVPMGPWANLLVSPETHSTGMPDLKGFPDLYVTIEKTNEEVLDMKRLMKRYYLTKGARKEVKTWNIL
ncbi:tungsten-dependent formylmethanofuran dehydrogenase subunit FwdD [Methanocaldococcus infernus]|uniref:Molybdopterin dinucleotide-binding region n=1 Tax=Methanocaldococcus infernus (strain DSM 11812 / JCM 15783 / ME) TaxID=573063 RepID=D5VT82_METIM|nr:tungsten-dependent formylmethanofuran dehydrogenase subunit FwdD [Methanocaldococcus infernus]ADG13785.1 molybdopterin dinucleotide-binding region [Methanocaldococcus infernus ME]